MKFLLEFPLSGARLWELSCAAIGCYLLLNPCLADPPSCAVALGGGLLLLLFKSIPSEAFTRVGRFWLLFLFYLLLSSSWSLAPGITLQSAGFFFLGTILFLMANSNDSQSQSRVEIAGFLLAAFAAVLALHQKFYGFDELALTLPQLSGEMQKIATAAVHNRRAFGPLVTPGALAALMILFIPLGFIRARISSGMKRFFYSVLTVVLAGGLWATGSVGALACLAAGVLCVLWYRRLGRWMAPVLIVGLSLAVLVILGRDWHSWHLASFSMRLKLWASAGTLFLSHPWFGTGLGTFAEAYRLAGMDLNTGSQYAHNILLQLLVETGLAGTALFSAAAASVLMRFQKPFRWEAWGILPGVLAFVFFGLVDLPFQMPELVWLFALAAGRLSLWPEKEMRLPQIPVQWLEWGLLAVLLVSGFWPPFRPWNLALLACALWALSAYFQARFEKVPLWIFAGALFLAVRSFVSPSALGAVWFFELSGIALVFLLILPHFKNSRFFLTAFSLLGLAWALKAWWISFCYGVGGFSSWLHFQYSDVKEWVIFPNPKQVGIFLIPLVFLFWKKPLNWKKVLVLLFSVLTMLRLKAFSAFLGVGIGLVAILKAKNRLWVLAGGLAIVLVLLGLRSLDPSPTKWQRFGIWESAVRVWEMAPLAGVGPGAFAGLYHQVKSPRTEGVSRYLMDAQYAHNEPLELLAAFGLIGFAFGFFLFWMAWKKLRDAAAKSAVAGLTAASLVDFCLHTPLIALLGIGFFSGDKPVKPKPGFTGAFLALGLALGLFGAACFAGMEVKKSENEIAQKRFPEALRCLERAEQLNAWDARFAEAKAGFLEKLYLATKDPAWERKADEAAARVLDLEKADGQKLFDEAERLTRRLEVDPSQPREKNAQAAWAVAHIALPYNGLAWNRDGLYQLHQERKKESLAKICFKLATELEPNYAAAWVNLGSLEKEMENREAALSAFRKALEIHRRWKDEKRIAPVERELVSLAPETIAILEKETKP
jgi:O-antigen ligase